MIDDSWVLDTALAERTDKRSDSYVDAFKEALGSHFKDATPEERQLLMFGAICALRVWCASVGVAAASHAERNNIDQDVAFKRVVRVLGTWVPNVEVALAEEYVGAAK